MARTTFPTMAHQPPHHPAAKPAPTKPVSAKPASGHPSGGPQRPHPAHRPGHAGRVTALVLGAAIIAAGIWYGVALKGDKLDATGQLLEQMQAAAAGTVAPVHVFGGALTATRANGRSKVTAEGLPSKPCVQVGWRLSKEGTIIVNGVLAQRLSAAKLSEMCSGDGATLTWLPEE